PRILLPFLSPTPMFAAPAVIAAALLLTAGSAAAQAMHPDAGSLQALVDFELEPPAWQPPAPPPAIAGLDLHAAPPPLVWPAGLPANPQDVPAPGAPAEYSSTIA